LIKYQNGNILEGNGGRENLIIKFLNIRLPLLDLFFMIIIVSHFVALLWHALAEFEASYLNYTNTWLHMNDYYDLEVNFFIIFTNL